METSQRMTLEEGKRHRREQRAARRDAQRLANADRAAAMHRQRLAFERGSLELPQEEEQPPPLRGSIFVGCSGWYYWHWKDQFYPATLPRNRWFQHYAERFRTVELNAPFYAWPTTTTVRRWLRQAAGKPFIYTVKVCELITNVKRFSGTK